MTVLERLYHKGKLDFGSSGAGAFDRLKAGEYLASDYEKGHFKHVYEDIIKPAVEKAGYVAIRADEVNATNLIHLDILKKLIDTPIAVCDLSTRNPNVLFELGIRQSY